MKKIFLLAIGFLLFASPQVYSTPVLFDSEATFLGSLGTYTTYDFEASSGFPTGSTFNYIGTFDGINFDASTYYNGHYLTQTLTGPISSHTTATIDFSSLSDQPYAIGFYGLDLTLMRA